ncbi:hypothetical protein BpHYR1_026886 [Brachionus plicatilis]|uniref:Uncharacterized protein n=1 Tax=Brachionus plicatilis TaxID=10195 RepID=A0A3M7T8D3_BRAPC|nr:hypothetical protein BpHYR1_026886 [Brachionus plicatilis]
MLRIRNATLFPFSKTLNIMKNKFFNSVLGPDWCKTQNLGSNKIVTPLGRPARPRPFIFADAVGRFVAGPAKRRQRLFSNLKRHCEICYKIFNSNRKRKLWNDQCNH